MTITRRRVLGTAVAAAVAPLLVSCGADRPPTSVRPPAAGPSDPPRPVRSPLFSGEPEPGNLYFGASVPYYRSLPSWESALGERLAVNRSYFDPDETLELVAEARNDLRNRRLPHLSIKPPGTWADVAGGRLDHWLTDMLTGLGKERSPVFLTINHEPENESGSIGMGPQDFVAMQRRAIRLAAEIAPHVTVVPVLQQWTFDPGRVGTDPAGWVVPEAEVFGLDVYNPWSPSNGKAWRSLGSKVDEVAPWVGGKPIVIGEYGCRVDPAHPGRTSAWLQDAVEYARAHRVVSMSYYNSRLNAPDGSWELTGESELEFRRLLAAPWVARLA